MSAYFFESNQNDRQEIFPGVTISTMSGEKMMLSHAVLEPNAVVRKHSHPHEQVGIVLEGSAQFRIGSEEKTLKTGDMYVIPGDVEHEVVAGNEGVVALDIFHPIREEYLP